MAAVGLLAKLVEGKGGQIDVAMYDVMLSQLNYLAGASLNAGERTRRYADSAHPYIVPAQLFRTRDESMVLFITHDEFWRKFCVEVGRADWLEDERFATMAARSANRKVVLEAIGGLLGSQTAEHWVGRLAPLGIVVSRVDTLEDALASGLARSRDMVVDLPCDGARLRATGAAIKCVGATPRFGPPPLLNEHGAEFGVPQR